MVKRPVKIYDFLEQLKDSLLLKAIMILIQKCYSISVCLHLGRKQPGLSQSYQLIWIVMMTDVGKPSIHEQSSSFMLLYRFTRVSKMAADTTLQIPHYSIWVHTLGN